MPRRHLFKGFLCLAIGLAAPVQPLIADSAPPPASLAELEKSSGGRLGVHAIDISTGKTIEHRAEERFPMCSTFKVILSAAILDESSRSKGLLEEKLTYTQEEIIQHSPITEKHLATGMTAADLCAATIQYSDNTAANVLLKRLGGPKALTRFTQKLGDPSFRLDRWEPELNSAIPGDPRDTTTPSAMTSTLRALTFGPALTPDGRKQLLDWMDGNTTGDKRIRAAAPKEWTVGDKTGSGSYGTTNDVAVIRRPDQGPIIMTIFLTGPDKKSPWRDDTIARAAAISITELSSAPEK